MGSLFMEGGVAMGRGRPTRKSMWASGGRIGPRGQAHFRAKGVNTKAKFGKGLSMDKERSTSQMGINTSAIMKMEGRMDLGSMFGVKMEPNFKDSSRMG